MAVSLKHVHVAGVSQHDLNNPWTIGSNVHMIILTGLCVGGGWAGWKSFGCRITQKPKKVGYLKKRKKNRCKKKY